MRDLRHRIRLERINKMGDRFKHPTIAQLVAEHARENPEAIALLAPGRSAMTYHELSQQIQSVSGALNRAGLGRNDRVAVVLPNGPELAAAFVTIGAAATFAPLNPGYRESEFEFYLSDLAAKALVVQRGIDSPAREVARKRGIAVVELVPGFHQAAGAFTLAAASDAACPRPGLARAEDIALVLHTSGTTSRPKLVPLTQRNVCSSADNVRNTLRLTAADRCLNVMPLFHIHGLIGATLSSLAAGASLVCSPSWEEQEFFKWLDAFQPTWYTAVPTIHQSVLAAARNTVAISNHRLRLIRSSSAPLPPQLLHDIELVFKVPVIEAYGMTEAAHQMCSNSLPPGQRKPGSVGVPAGPEVAVMDEAGRLLGPGATGEIVIRGANVTAGYQDNPAANEMAFTNGWFRTGDQGYRDEDGFYFLTGRLKELINRGGEKIAPREVDEVLMAHPAVAQAVAFAIPHLRLGEDVAAAVVLRAGSSVTDRELRQFALERLAPQKVPSQFVFVDSIPKGPTGKLQRIGLHAKLEPLLKAEFVPPSSPLEDSVARIWEEVLERKRPGVFDNFFYLGGDSLLAMRIASRFRSLFEIEIPVEAMFQAPTIADQAILIEELLIQEVERVQENKSPSSAEEQPDERRA